MYITFRVCACRVCMLCACMHMCKWINLAFEDRQLWIDCYFSTLNSLYAIISHTQAHRQTDRQTRTLTVCTFMTTCGVVLITVTITISIMWLLFPSQIISSTFQAYGIRYIVNCCVPWLCCTCDAYCIWQNIWVEKLLRFLYFFT